MKLSSSSSTKTISWPEKVPPPLLRFLRSNAKPRTRSKSRPPVTLFLRRKKNPTTTTTTQEPSSPKVTCIGQVRVRRSKISISKKKKSRFSNCVCRCGLFGNPCCCSCRWGCSCVNWKVFKAVWCFWVRLFTCGSAKVRTESPQTGSNRVQEKNAVEQSSDEGREEGDCKASTLKSPPKNALLLTRSRSAPYRSASLGCGVVGETESVKTESVKTEQVNEEETERKLTLSGIITGSEDDGEVEKKEECPEKKEKKEEEEEEEGGRRKLKRSRSEPVRRGCEKLDPLTSEFWIQRRLSNT